MQCRSLPKHSKISWTIWKLREVSGKRAWEILQEIRGVLKDVAGMEFQPAARKTIDLEGRLVKDGVRRALKRSPDRPHGPCPRHSRVQEAAG